MHGLHLGTTPPQKLREPDFPVGQRHTRVAVRRLHDDPRMKPLIMVCTDFSASSEVAVAHAAEITRLQRGRALIIHVCDPPGRKSRMSGTWDESAMRRLRDARRKYFGDLPDNDVQYDVVPSPEPVTAICAAARKEGASMVVVGSHGRTGLRRQLLGSVAENTVRNAPCSVLVARDADA